MGPGLAQQCGIVFFSLNQESKLTEPAGSTCLAKKGQLAWCPLPPGSDPRNPCDSNDDHNSCKGIYKVLSPVFSVAGAQRG